MSDGLPPGDHDYGELLRGISAGRYDFARVRTYAGSWVPLIGLSKAQFEEFRTMVSDHDVAVILYGSRVAGTRTHQHTLSPVLAAGVSLQSYARHPSVGIPGVTGMHIRKDVIKEYGCDNPLTSDLSIAALLGARTLGAETKILFFDLEQTLNQHLGATFPLKIFLTLHGFSFRTVRDFIDFGREFYIKRDLPPSHTFSDTEIDAAFCRTFVVVDPRDSL